MADGRNCKSQLGGCEIDPVAGNAASPDVSACAHSQKTSVCKTLFANSITLTPGTISVEVEEGRFLVHAVAYSDGDMEALADMDARVKAVETI